MGKIIRREFVGSRLLFLLLCLFLVTIPYAVIYLLEGLVTVEDDIDDPEKFLTALRQGKIG